MAPPQKAALYRVKIFLFSGYVIVPAGSSIMQMLVYANIFTIEYNGTLSWELAANDASGARPFLRIMSEDRSRFYHDERPAGAELFFKSQW